MRPELLPAIEQARSVVKQVHIQENNWVFQNNCF
jgi:hypothetical protein